MAAPTDEEIGKVDEKTYIKTQFGHVGAFITFSKRISITFTPVAIEYVFIYCQSDAVLINYLISPTEFPV